MNPLIATIIISGVITLVLFLIIHRWTGKARNWLGILMILLPSIDGLLSSKSTVWTVAGTIIIVAGILVVAWDLRGERSSS